MILEQITLTNFRCFESLEIPLDPHLNVFVGVNGSGKSTILRAIAIGLSPILQALPIEKIEPAVFLHVLLPEFHLTDVRTVEDDRSAPAANLSISARFEKKTPRHWMLEKTFSSRALDLSRGKTHLAQLIDHCSDLVKRHNAREPYLLPVFAFYSTDRSVSKSGDKVRDETLPQFFRRLAGMKDALNPVADFQRAVGWFDLLERRDLRDRRDTGGSAGGSSAFDAVRVAIAKMIDGIANPRIDGTTGRFVVDQPTPTGGRVKLFLDQLSDGYQVLLGVVMDFAIRLALASPPEWAAQAILESEAVLIIDEVDLHLHPAWQQQVVPRLRQTFPNTQIILTTHSPQVLSTVDQRYIRQITRDGNATPPPYQTRGVASSSVLATAMDVDPIPPVGPARWASDYRAAIQTDRDETAEARALWQRLVDHFEAKHPIIAELEALRRFQAFKRENRVGPTGVGR